MSKFLSIGFISGVHGIKGEVKIEAHSDIDDLMDVFNSAQELELYLKSKTDKDKTGKDKTSKEKADKDKKEAKSVFKVTSFRKHKTSVLVTLEGVVTRNDSEALKGMEVEVLRDVLPDLKEGEFYLADLIGVPVIDERGSVKPLGTFKDVMNAGGGDVYVVAREGEEDILIPATRETILEINAKDGEGYIKVKVPEGLLSDED